VKFITKLRFKLQIWFIKCLYQFVVSKQSDRVIGKELKDDMLKRIAGLDAAIRILTDERREE